MSHFMMYFINKGHEYGFFNGFMFGSIVIPMVSLILFVCSFVCVMLLFGCVLIFKDIFYK